MEAQQWRVCRSGRLVEEPELYKLNAKLEAIETLRQAVAGEADALSRPKCIVDSRTPHEAGIDTAADIPLVRKVQRVKHAAVRGMWQRGMVRVIPALCGCYASFILLLFCCYSAAILLLSCCYSAAILLLSCCYSGFIPALFFYAVLYAALYSVLYARQQTTTTSTAATSNSNKTQMSPNSDSATKGTRTDKKTGKGAVVLDHQPARPLSSCVFSAEAEEPVGRLNIPGPSDR